MTLSKMVELFSEKIMGGVKKQKYKLQSFLYVASKEQRPKSSRLMRLQARMKGYRERSKLMEDRQFVTECGVTDAPPQGYNLFCREAPPRKEALTTQQTAAAREAIMDFNENLFDSGHGDSDNPVAGQELCWLCGELCHSVREHAVAQHFSDWITETSRWELTQVTADTATLSIRCPQCSRMFPELSSFSDHVMKEHEGLLTWLQFNGFDMS